MLGLPHQSCLVAPSLCGFLQWVMMLDDASVQVLAKKEEVGNTKRA